MAKKKDQSKTVKASTGAPAAPPKKPAAPKPAAEQKNGITRPKDGTKTGRIWQVADELSAKNKASAKRGDVMAICEGEGLNKATIATQYGRWCKFNGITRETKKAAAPASPAK